jgi:predicted aspartyl protease
MSRRLLTIAIAALALSGSPAFAQANTTILQAGSGADKVDRTTQTEDVRFRTDQNLRMTVPVLLSGTGPYRFLVDTGANRTALSRTLAARLNLPAGDRVEVHSAVGVSTVDTATVPSLRLTRKDMKIVDAPLLEDVNMGADGVLGVDSLRAQRVMFDFEKQTMAIVPSAAPDFRAESGTIVVQARRRNGRLLLTEASANGHSIVVVIDTGSEVSVGNEALRRQLLGSKLLHGTDQVQLETVTGEKLLGDYMFVRELEVGGFGLSNLAVVFADAHVFKELNLNDRPALLLGMNAMRAFKKVSIDFAAKTLRVIVPEHSQLDWRMASAGR